MTDLVTNHAGGLIMMQCSKVAYATQNDYPHEDTIFQEVKSENGVV
jgi:hypothetical protein